MEIDDVFDEDKYENLCIELKKYLLQHKRLKNYLKQDNKSYDGQLIFEPYAITFSYSQETKKYNVRMFIHYNNSVGTDNYFELKKNNMTKSLKSAIVDTLSEFENGIRKDVSGVSALETIKLSNPKVKLRFNSFSNLLKSEVKI